MVSIKIYLFIICIIKPLQNLQKLPLYLRPSGQFITIKRNRRYRFSLYPLFLSHSKIYLLGCSISYTPNSSWTENESDLNLLIQ